MLYPFGNKRPVVSKNAFVADTACIVGDVSIEDGASVWFNSVIRGDQARINIGKGSSVQDNTVIHTDDNEVVIGERVVIGHGCIMHGKSTGNDVLLGMNSTILHGAQVGDFAIVGAGSLVPPGYKVPANSVVMGVPCKFVRKTTEDDHNVIRETLQHYARLVEGYLAHEKY